MQVDPRDTVPHNGPTTEALPPADVRLIEQLRAGDADAGRRLVDDYYPGVYRYLLYLTARRELAEDLTQETFLQAWRHLDQFAGRAPLRVWLHRIAHREFLQSLRRARSASQRTETEARSLEELGEAAAPAAEDWREAVELRELLRKLPVEEREVLVLHYLHGYSSAEIGQIVRAPAGTVRYRLAMARAKLQRELGEGDLVFLNEPSVPMRSWAWLPLDQMRALETHLTLGGAAHREGSSMERREFLRQAAVGAAGLVLSETEKEVMDSRLTQKVTCAFKGTALTDLCDRLRSDTGIQLTAGPSVADEKVTLFCGKLPLRDVMRQLSRPFGYTWLRSGTPGQYRYELVQDLRSQLLEEELRNRDRNTALLALDQELGRYRKYLGLSPDEALQRAKTAPSEDRPLLERMATNGWGQIQMYFRLSPQQQTVLLAGEGLKFSQEPKPSEQPLPAEIARGVLESQRNRRIFVRDGQFHLESAEKSPDGMRLAAVPEARAAMTLRLQQSELGQFTLSGHPGVFIAQSSPMSGDFYLFAEGPTLATGMSPAALDPDNAAANARLAHDPALQTRVTVEPGAREGAPATRPDRLASMPALPPDAKRLTSADVLEALHRATGIPIIADFYTRLYAPEAVTVREQPLFETLNRLADAMRLRWNRDASGGTAARSGAGPRGDPGGWFQFRSASFFNDRLKEVPNRFLARWSASRRLHQSLPLDDLIEIAGLPDAQLNGKDMAEGAKVIWGLSEWDLVQREHLRPHLRFLAELTSEQRQMALGATGLPFTRMSLAQQQKFLSFLLQPDAQQLPSQSALSNSVMRVAYTQPDWFQWTPPEAHWYLPSPVQERTRDAALRAARRIDPHATEAQIAPTRLDVTFLYLSGDSDSLVRLVRLGDDGWTH